VPAFAALPFHRGRSWPETAQNANLFILFYATRLVKESLLLNFSIYSDGKLPVKVTLNRVLQAEKACKTGFCPPKNL